MQTLTLATTVVAEKIKTAAAAQSILFCHVVTARTAVLGRRRHRRTFLDCVRTERFLSTHRTPELSTAPSNPTHQLTDPTQPNPPKTEKSRPDPTRPNPSHGSTQPTDDSAPWYSWRQPGFATSNIVSSGLLLKMEVGIRKTRGEGPEGTLLIYDHCIRCQKTRRLVYGVYPRIPPPNTPLIVSLVEATDDVSRRDDVASQAWCSANHHAVP